MPKKIKLDLLGTNGNAFAVLAAFKRAAKLQGWNAAQIDVVVQEAKSKDYDHLLATLQWHIKR